jgi:hypothetical protein
MIRRTCSCRGQTDQRQIGLGVERVAMGRLLSGSVQGDVDATLVGQNHLAQIAQHLSPVGLGQLGVLRDLLLDLFRGQRVLVAKRPRLKVAGGYAVFHQVVPSAFHAPLGKSLVVFRRAARVRVGNVDGPT